MTDVAFTPNRLATTVSTPPPSSAAPQDVDYVFVAPDGSRALIGVSKSDPDWVGYAAVDSSAGSTTPSQNQVVTGLDDAEVRDNHQFRAQADGAIQGANWYGGRPITFQGIIIPDTGFVADIIRRENKLKAALNAVRQDGTLTWTDPLGTQKMVKFRKNAPVRIIGQVMRSFFISIYSPRVEIWGASSQTVSLVPAGSVTTYGVAFPITFPVTFAIGGALAEVFVTNAGSMGTWPVWTINGPLQNPTLTNVTTGLKVDLSVNLTASDQMVIDFDQKTVTVNGVSQYSALTGGSWWQLVPGTNNVSLSATTYASPASATLVWRDAYL